MAEQMYPQSAEKNEYRYLDFRWLDEVATGLTAGAQKHPGETWRDIPAEEHTARAIRHLSLWLAGDRSDSHIINASMRCMMARAMERVSQVGTGENKSAGEEKPVQREGKVAVAEKKAKQTRICTECRKAFVSLSGRTRYCSPECRKSAQKMAARGYYEQQKAKKKDAKKVIVKKEKGANLDAAVKAASEAGMSYGKFVAARSAKSSKA